MLPNLNKRIFIIKIISKNFKYDFLKEIKILENLFKSLNKFKSLKFKSFFSIFKIFQIQKFVFKFKFANFAQNFLVYKYF